jgi:hypothetical protein
MRFMGHAWWMRGAVNRKGTKVKKEDEDLIVRR